MCDVQQSRHVWNLEIASCLRLAPVCGLPATALRTRSDAKFGIAKDCLLTLVKSRLALGSPGHLVGWLFVTMPRMAEYTDKWLLTPP